MKAVLQCLEVLLYADELRSTQMQIPGPEGFPARVRTLGATRRRHLMYSHR
jgi:hypothetical protein